MLDKILGNAKISDGSEFLKTFISKDEEIYISFKFLRDEITLSSQGIYYIDVQGMTGKKISIEFYPIKSLDSVSYETAGTLDLDSDLKIHVRGKADPISIKISKKDQDASIKIIKIMKKYYWS